MVPGFISSCQEKRIIQTLFVLLDFSLEYRTTEGLLYLFTKVKLEGNMVFPLNKTGMKPCAVIGMSL